MKRYLLVVVLQKIIQISILIFLEAQEKKLLINLQGSECNGYCINFLWEFFSFYEKVHSLRDPAVLPKKPLSPKNFLEVNKGIERLQQNALNVFQIPTQSKSSDRALHRPPELRALDMIFFTIPWRARSADKSTLKIILGCYQNRNPSKTFLFCRVNFTSKKFKKLFLVGVTFNNKTGLKFTVQNSIELRLRRFDESVLKQLRQKLWKTVRKRM